jgi:hypothetical protein
VTPTRLIHSARLEYVETTVMRPTPLGPSRCVLVNALIREEPVPTLAVVTAMLSRVSNEWLLCSLMIEDEARRCGFATEVVRFYEDRLGHFGAAWVSDVGEAFARSYTARFGPRPLWQIGLNPVHEAAIARAFAAAGRTARSPS